MPIGIIGLNHDTAPVELRERLSFGKNEVSNALEGLHEIDEVDEGVLLSTCNRLEFYFYGEEGCIEEKVLSWLANEGGFDRGSLVKHVYSYKEIDTAEHLFKVVTGLDSMVLGEVEVAGQVKESYRRSKESDKTGKYLNQLFQKSFEVNKEVRSELELDGLPVSLSHLAVDRVEEELGSLEEATAMVIGVGEVGELTLRYLLEHGIDKVRVANRTRKRSREVTKNIGGEPIAYEEREEYLPETEVVITATGCPTTILGTGDLSSAGLNSLYIVDLAVPRDVEPEVGELKGCNLYDVDGLKDLAELNKERRNSEAESVTPIINRQLEEFQEWLNIQEVTQVIGSLKKRAEMIKQKEIDELKDSNLGKEDVEKISDRILGDLLHEPVIELKEAAKNGDDTAKLAESLVRLFDL